MVVYCSVGLACYELNFLEALVFVNINIFNISTKLFLEYFLN